MWPGDVRRRELDRRLYSGRYFIQDVDLKAHPEQAWATGCHSDQLLGQWWAHVLDLGHVLPEAHVAKALASIVRHNFRKDLKGIEQNRPNQHFYESVKTFLRLITTSIGIPVEYLLFDFTKSNFSQSRSTLTLAYYVFREWQQLMIRLFHRRVWNWLAGTWVADGSLWLPKSMEFAELMRAQTWMPPAFPWVDPLKEAQAWEKQLAVNLSTHAQAIAASGHDRDEQNDQREKEIKDAIARAHRLSAATGEVIDWRMFAGLITGKTEAAAKVKKGEPLTVTVDDADDGDKDENAAAKTASE